MGIYEQLGVRRLINASGNFTRLGGSLMPSVVLEAMTEAAHAFVELDELQAHVGQRIAELTHNEWAYVSNGAAAGLALCVAACMTGKDPAKMRRLPDTTGMKSAVIMFKSHRNGYDHAVRQTGATIVEIGFANHTLPWELEAAINENTAAVVYMVFGPTGQADRPLNEVVRVAHRYDVPVIVDAAAQLPPKDNLWHFTRDTGADIAIFSGGKNLRGPANSGLVLGKREIIEAAALNGPPHHSLGRSMKVGKEEMVGVLAALEWYLNRDEVEWIRQCEDAVQHWIEVLSGLPHVRVERCFPNLAGQPIPRARLILDERALGWGRDELIRRLRAGDPSIAVVPAEEGAIYVNPMTLEEEEVKIVADRLKDILAQGGSKT